MLNPGKYLTQAEQDHLEAILAKYRQNQLRNTTMLMIMLKAGARPQEVLNLTWADVSLPDKSMHFRTLKGGIDRTIPLTDDLVGRLKEYGLSEPNERIFRIGYNQFVKIWHMYRPVKKKLHCLRHTFAVNLYRKSKFNVQMVQQALGHSSLITTSVYLKLETGLEDMREFICL